MKHPVKQIILSPSLICKINSYVNSVNAVLSLIRYRQVVCSLPREGVLLSSCFCNHILIIFWRSLYNSVSGFCKCHVVVLFLFLFQHLYFTPFKFYSLASSTDVVSHGGVYSNTVQLAIILSNNALIILALPFPYLPVSFRHVHTSISTLWLRLGWVKLGYPG